MIDGVAIKKLVTHADERGYFRELIRSSDPFFDEGFGQWSVSRMFTGAVKAWHIHKTQIDWWYVHCGVLKVALHDLRESSKSRGKTMEMLMGDNQESAIVKIPPGVAHGCKCLSGPVDLFYVTSNVYDPSDEGRIAHDDKRIGYDWTSPTRIT